MAWVLSLDQADLMEDGVAAHSSILVGRIPWTEEPGGLQSTGLQRVGHERSNLPHRRLKSNLDLTVKKQDKVLKNRIKECFSDFWSGILFKNTAIRIGIFDDITIFNVCLLSHH